MWRKTNYDATAFPKTAAAALAKHQPSGHLDALDPIRSIGNNHSLPSQQDLEANFSNLPITLFVGTRFFIDIYFWLDGTTTIHQHGFAGAFQVLSGSSLHCHYDFVPKQIVNPHFQIGKMSLRKTLVLSQGDIKPIIPGSSYIHSLFHLDRPSATITIRTPGLPTAQPQFSYLKPGIAYDPFFKEPSTIKKVQSVNLLLAMRHPEADSIIKKMLSRSDLHTAFQILAAAYQHLTGDIVEQYMGISRGARRFDKLLNTFRTRHGSTADMFSDAFAEGRRQAKLVVRRSYVANEDLRFFLALLLNVASRKQILRLVQERFPGEQPIGTVLNWVEELSQIKVLASDESNALGIDGFEDRHLFLIEGLLRGKSLRQMQTEWRKLFPHETANQLNRSTEKIYLALKDTSILAPLFVLKS
ncbi:MAG: hypothetical protein AABM67_07820 [Acidobacteriota bacterium]